MISLLTFSNVFYIIIILVYTEKKPSKETKFTSLIDIDSQSINNNSMSDLYYIKSALKHGRDAFSFIYCVFLMPIPLFESLEEELSPNHKINTTCI